MDKVLMKTSYIRSGPFLPEMRPNGPISNYDYMMELYKDSSIRNMKEMNMLDTKDDSTEDSSDESADRLVIAECEAEESSGDSEQGQTSEDRNSVIKDSNSVDADSNSMDSDYVYTLNGSATEETETSPDNTQDTETFNKDQDSPLDFSKSIDSDVNENTGYVYVIEPDNNETQDTKGESDMNKTNQEIDTNNPVDFSCKAFEVNLKCFAGNVMNDMTKGSNSRSEANNNQDSSKHSVLYQSTRIPNAVKLTGASKRKRKFSLENTITHLLKSKCSRQEDSSSGEDSNHSQTFLTDGAIKQETVFNDVNVVDLRVQKGTSGFSENKQSASVHNRQAQPLLESLSVSKKPNRRKSSVVSRCVNNIESESQNNLLHNTQNVAKTPETNTHEQPLDFSINKTAEVITAKPQQVRTKEPGVIDLSVKNTINNTTNHGVKQAKTDAPSLPLKSELMDMMKKYSSQYVNHNMMNQGMIANMLQLQLWMQAAAMNNVISKNGKSEKVLKNDVNKNVVMRDLLTTPSFPNVTAANMGMVMANQMANSPVSDGTATYLNKIKTKAAKVLEKDLLVSGIKNSELNELDMQKYSGPGITNWTTRLEEEAMGKIFLTKYREEKNGDPVKFFVRDNEQVQAIMKMLVETGTLLPDQIPLGSEQMRYMCSVCEQRFFHVEHLNKHIKKRHILKKFMCTVCDRSFHDAGNFRQHMRVHDASDVPYECPECQRKFRHKCTLKVHMRIHTGEKPFKCEICQASFKISSGLQTHMRKHTGETPYACEYCNMRFKCQSNLKQHLFQHTQARPFSCDVCNKNYSRKSIRDSHRQTHFKGDLYKGSPETLSADDSLIDTSMEI